MVASTAVHGWAWRIAAYATFIGAVGFGCARGQDAGSSESPQLRIEAGFSDGDHIIFQGQPVTLFAHLVNETAQAAWTVASKSYMAAEAAAAASGKQIDPFQFAVADTDRIPLPSGEAGWASFAAITLDPLDEKGISGTPYWSADVISEWFATQGVIQTAESLDETALIEQVDLSPTVTAKLPEGMYRITPAYKWSDTTGKAWTATSLPQVITVKLATTAEEKLDLNLRAARYYYHNLNGESAAEAATAAAALDAAGSYPDMLLILGWAAEKKKDIASAVNYYTQYLEKTSTKHKSDDMSSTIEKKVEELKSALEAGTGGDK